MRTSATLTAILIVGYHFCTSPTQAQVTNPCSVVPATKLESFETNVAVVIFSASSELGSIPASGGAVVVRCRETTDTSTGTKAQGIVVAIRGLPKDTVLIDYDEIESLWNALDFFGKLQVSMTPLATFDAAYTTKGGLRIAALGTRRTGAIRYLMRDTRSGSAPVSLSATQLNQFLGLINQAKATLDSLRG
jgi:hypothetical protein